MLRNVHRFLGRFLAAFLVLHFLTHLSALFGPDVHVGTLGIFQYVYRNVVVEPLLLVAIVTQVGSGVRLFFQRRHSAQRNIWSRIQLISGLYLAMFFIIHTSAALYTRHVGNLETNFWWASGTLVHPVLKFGFFPYYFLGLIAAFAHVACSFDGRSPHVARVILFGGAFMSFIIVMTFGGAFYRVDAKPEYRAYYDNLFGLTR